MVLAENHRSLGILSCHFFGRLKVNRARAGLERYEALLGLFHVGSVWARLKVLVVGVNGHVRAVGLVVKGGHLKKLLGRFRGHVVERELCEHSVQDAHSVGESADDFHGHRRVFCDKFGILVAHYGDHGYIGHCDYSFNLQVVGHAGNNAHEVSRSQDCLLLARNFHVAHALDLSNLNDEKSVALRLAFYDKRGAFLIIYK